MIPLICGLSNLDVGQKLRLRIFPWLLFVLLHFKVVNNTVYTQGKYRDLMASFNETQILNHERTWLLGHGYDDIKFKEH